MGWGNSWDKPKIELIPPTEPENQYWSSGALIFEEMSKAEFDKKYCRIDMGAGDSQTVMTTFEDGQFKHRIIPYEELYIENVEPNFKNLISAYATVRNRKPTHDPYTNPNAHIYYECNCGAILDPQTKSFAALNNYASDKGWKIRFTDKGYVPYCVKCGEGVE